MDDESWALSPDTRKPLPELIEDKLRQLIESGRFKAGDRLPTEPELAQRMAVARSSLRTALQRLQLQGIVEVMRGRGWYVRSTDLVDREDALVLDTRVSESDLIEVRIALEATAASLAALRADEGEIDEIAKRAKDHQTAPNDDKEELLRTDEEFHAAVVRASHNELLEQVYRSLVPKLRGYRRTSYGTAELHNRSATEHNQVAWFLKRHDEGGARVSMTTHLLGLYNDLASQAGTPVDERAALNTYVYDSEDEPRWHRH
ncbi:FCD domain-containing protein [Amycolatopsis acidiphila]|uniref:FadR family transcriptional regulator n=1 Tax=Amycolatopsis acidiphila TaxID=715473 RepID=A0A558AMS9_9PSEU|nr:FCD domain-containing protein [Amycolatopsis acidiphila]TVT25567.1 FadR family transcriptional regulator [Amycolatopsis acidiphila]UIJ60317.1 FCD domain-containing protein [Amycolatopsis acidiphila]GHG90723.1 GntR family transcriptional regulator [Amycolatopsis acidiphila]